jgi:hypothetical protein
LRVFWTSSNATTISQFVFWRKSVKCFKIDRIYLVTTIAINFPTEIVYWSRFTNLYYFIPRFSGVGIIFFYQCLSVRTRVYFHGIGRECLKCNHEVKGSMQGIIGKRNWCLGSRWTFWCDCSYVGATGFVLCVFVCVVVEVYEFIFYP